MRPNEIDDCVLAEIPDPATNKELPDLVITHMIHRPYYSADFSYAGRMDHVPRDFPNNTFKILSVEKILILFTDGEQLQWKTINNNIIMKLF
ncbi:Hypothetical predicted protein [Octopus vulgaris]|uniref:Uncharacterized protein n=1 Tax=Octopus vulgaris TaxID=6645 RepID=A0AA36BBF7_OCTVU|nr:Hypothetical predicted protein [Octopus vulgaris]